MRAYFYKGNAEVFIPNYGVVYPQQTIQTNVIINHPDFEEVLPEQREQKPKKVRKYKKN